jgi:glycerol-3-phosphate dehydrogenase
MKIPPLPPEARDPDLLTRRRFDVLIIGGGINGAGIARDLALRGLQVALVDKGDFGSGASSASTKLIHGGLRYLERFDLPLVFESCRERRILQMIAPHLVTPIPFLIPAYRGDSRSLLTMRAGLLLYDLLAMFRNTGRHTILSPSQTLELEPLLRQKGLRGAARYWDCRMDDARLCLENVLAARTAGAVTTSYLEATSFLRRNGRLRGAVLRDRESGRSLEAEAHIVVNAAGPWLDSVCALDGESTRKLRPSRGSHIIIPRLNRREEALYLTAGQDDRLFFVIPWGDCSLVGTTDVEYPADPDQVEPTADEIDYLLAETGRHLRGCGPGRQDVIAAFAGLRPLIAAPGGSISSVPREHRIFQSASGLISVGGGKYTTYRAVAAEVAALITERLGLGRGRSQTDRIMLPGGDTGDFADFARRHLPRLTGDLGFSPGLSGELLRRYGSRIPLLLDLIEREAGLASPVIPGSPLLAGEVVFAAEWDMARTPEDVLRRRTSLALQRGQGLEELPAVAQLLAERLNLNGSQGWQDDYRKRFSKKGSSDGSPRQTRKTAETQDPLPGDRFLRREGEYTVDQGA